MMKNNDTRDSGMAYAGAVSDFEANGLCCIKGFLTKEQVAELQNESNRLWQSLEDSDPGNLRIGLRKDLGGQCVHDRLDPVEDISAPFAQLNSDPRIVTLVELLLGEKARVMKEKLIYKHPKTSGFGVHRDAPYFESCGAKGYEMLSVAVALDPANAESGAIQFYPSLRLAELESPDGEPRDIDESDLDNVEAFIPEFAPGDIAVFDGIVPHRSDFNLSDRSRRLYCITYIPARYQDGRKAYYQDRMQEQRLERQKTVTESCFFK